MALGRILRVCLWEPDGEATAVPPVANRVPPMITSVIFAILAMQRLAPISLTVAIGMRSGSRLRMLAGSSLPFPSCASVRMRQLNTEN